MAGTAYRIMTATATSGWTAKFVPWREAKVHVLTHGLHYASAVFEGERAYGGRIFESRRTTRKRLHRSARILGFDSAVQRSSELEEAKARGAGEVRARERLCARDRLARVSEMMGVSAQHNSDPPGRRGVALGGLFCRQDERHRA
jgi:branched-chain amino acid aminotransferase